MLTTTITIAEHYHIVHILELYSKFVIKKTIYTRLLFYQNRIRVDSVKYKKTIFRDISN